MYAAVSGLKRMASSWWSRRSAGLRLADALPDGCRSPRQAVDATKIDEGGLGLLVLLDLVVDEDLTSFLARFDTS